MKRRDAIKGLLLGSTIVPFTKVSAEEKKYKAVGERALYESSSIDIARPKIYKVGVKQSIKLYFENLPSDISISCLSEDGVDLQGNRYEAEASMLYREGQIDGYGKQDIISAKTLSSLAFKRSGGVIELENIVFKNEGRYVFAVRLNCKNRVIARAWVYALNRDLFEMRPYVGDIHMHSVFSDGENSNIEMALVGLERGFDFLAISDHRRRIGSTDLIKTLADVPMSMSVFPAEEAHASILHINNFGSTGSIEDWSKNERADFDLRTNRILKTIPDSLNLSKIDKLTLAQSEAVFEKIRELGGLAIFNHPYWRRDGERFYVSDALRDALISRGKFDAIEVINGSINYDSTDLSIMRYYQAIADGYKMAIVGCSDAHKVEELGCGLTIAFAKSNSLEDIKHAIVSHNVVALDTFASYERPKIVGSARLMKYVSFLWKNFFPIHDELCKKHSNTLREFLRTPKDEKLYKKLKSQVEEIKSLYSDMWIK